MLEGLTSRNSKSRKHLQKKNLNVSESTEFLIARLENIEGKGENAGNQHFLLLPHCFQML